MAGDDGTQLLTPPTTCVNMLHSSAAAYDMLFRNNLDGMEREIASQPSLINDCSLNGGETLLMAACVVKNKAAVRVLLSLGADTNIKCHKHKGETAIYKTCTLTSPNNLAIARMLIDNGARLDVKTDREKYSPLHQACFCGRSAIATLLIENGANCNAMNHYNETPLHIALRYKHVSKEVALLMVKKGADLYNPVDIRGKRPIDYIGDREKEFYLSESPAPTKPFRHSSSGGSSSRTPSKTPSRPPGTHSSLTRPRSSSITSTPEKKAAGGYTPPVTDPMNVMDASIPVRSYSRSILYKANGQSTPMKQGAIAQSPMKAPQPTPSGGRSQSPLSNEHRSPLVFTSGSTRLSPSPSQITRDQSPPRSRTPQRCPQTPPRDRPSPGPSSRASEVPTATLTSLASPSSSKPCVDQPVFSPALSQSLISRPSSSSQGDSTSIPYAKHHTPGRQPPPAPPNTPSITQFFAAAGRTVIAKDLSLPAKQRPSQPGVTASRKRKSKELSTTDRASCVDKKGRISRKLHSDSSDEENHTRKKSSSKIEGYRKRSCVYSSSEESEAEEEIGYSSVPVSELSLDELKYASYIGMRFLDTDDHVVFKVDSICSHPEYEGRMFKYFVVSGASVEDEPPEDDDDFEYSMCEEMVSDGSWAQWLTIEDHDEEAGSI